MYRPGQSNQLGFSLLEVLVSGAILSSGLAGLAALLLATVSGTAQTGHRTTASMLADSMAAQIVITSGSLRTFLLAPPDITLNCDAGNSCSAAQFAAANLRAWQLEVARRLPGGEGWVCLDGSPFDGNAGAPLCDGGRHLVVKVFWRQGARLGTQARRVVKIAG